jgi:hypothetical protein
MSPRMPVQSSRKHHFIPAFYLKQWALNQDELIAWSKPHDTIIAQRRHPNATGFQLDLNTFTSFRGTSGPSLKTSSLKARMMMRVALSRSCSHGIALPGTFG